MYTDWYTTVVSIGIVAYFTVRLSRFIYLYSRPSSLQKYRLDGNTWALVTGASDGIGFALAQELASNGFNVVIHGRNPSKLETCKSRLMEEYPHVKFRVLVADASVATKETIERIAADLRPLNLRIVINNVGGGSVIKPLKDHTSLEVDVMMNLNARFPIQLTRALLPDLINRFGPALIINIGSMGDEYGVPYAVPYGSSKGFNLAMSNSLDIELRTEGNDIEVLGIPVGGVTEVAHKTNKPTFFTPGARTIAKATLARVGCGSAIVVGYVGHAVQKFFLDLLPNAVRESFIVPVMKDYREKALKDQ